MSLRTRLVISFTVLLLIAILAVGFVASQSTQDILVAQIDRTLLGIAERGRSQILGPAKLHRATNHPRRMSNSTPTPSSGQRPRWC